MEARALPELTAKLLTSFTDSKLAEYVEPTKKGTPKGDPVGFSLTKYKASLYALRVLDSASSRTKDLKVQAKDLGISYDLLRKWRSEEAFKELVSQHEKEFASGFLDAACQNGATEINVNLKDKFRVLELMKALLDGKFELIQSEGEKEAIIKLLILILARIKDEVMTFSNVTGLREYQRFALDLISELLQDRQGAIRHHKDAIDLLSQLRETLV